MKNIFLISPLFFLTGCVGPNIEALTESTAVIAFVSMLVLIALTQLSPKFEKWKLPKKISEIFITKVSIWFSILLVIAGVAFLFTVKRLGFLISLTFFISAAFLYKLQHNYENKSEVEKITDKKTWVFTLVITFVLLFLFFGGLAIVLEN